MGHTRLPILGHIEASEGISEARQVLIRLSILAVQESVGRCVGQSRYSLRIDNLCCHTTTIGNRSTLCRNLAHTRFKRDAMAKTTPARPCLVYV